MERAAGTPTTCQHQASTQGGRPSGHFPQPEGQQSCAPFAHSQVGLQERAWSGRGVPSPQPSSCPAFIPPNTENSPDSHRKGSGPRVCGCHAPGGPHLCRGAERPSTRCPCPLPSPWDSPRRQTHRLESLFDSSRARPHLHASCPAGCVWQAALLPGTQQMPTFSTKPACSRQLAKSCPGQQRDSHLPPTTHQGEKCRQLSAGPPAPVPTLQGAEKHCHWPRPHSDSQIPILTWQGAVGDHPLIECGLVSKFFSSENSNHREAEAGRKPAAAVPAPSQAPALGGPTTARVAQAPSPHGLPARVLGLGFQVTGSHRPHGCSRRLPRPRPLARVTTSVWHFLEHSGLATESQKPTCHGDFYKNSQHSGKFTKNPRRPTWSLLRQAGCAQAQPKTHPTPEQTRPSPALWSPSTPAVSQLQSGQGLALPCNLTGTWCWLPAQAGPAWQGVEGA